MTEKRTHLFLVPTLVAKVKWELPVRWQRERSLNTSGALRIKSKTLPKLDGQHDFEQLSLVMQELKRRMPEKQDITVLLEETTDYQTLVTVMDKVRAYPTVLGLEVVQAELFPVISLGDTAAAQQLQQRSAAASTSIKAVRS